MSLHEFKAGVTKLAESRQDLEAAGHTISISWMNEPLLHPAFVEMAAFKNQVFPDAADVLDSDWPTTGIPIASRPDWQDILEAVRSLGVDTVFFTVSGPEALHDRLVNRVGAFRQMASAIDRTKQSGFTCGLRILVSRPMLRSFDATLDAVHVLEADITDARVSEYAPVPRIRAFESERPTLEEIEPHHSELIALSQHSERTFWESVEQYTECHIREQVLRNRDRYPSFAELERAYPVWLFLGVFPGLQVYRGLYGAYTDCIGSLVDDSAQQLAQTIASTSPNYEFAAFYDLTCLPTPQYVAEHYADPASTALCRSDAGALQKWLDHAVASDPETGYLVRDFAAIPQYR
jgi:hypothetical protein